MADDKERAHLSKMSGAHLAALFLITAPVMGWAGGWAFALIATSMSPGNYYGSLAVLGIPMGVALGVLPVVWVAGLIAAWRDLGRDRYWLVRNSPPALAGVFILTAIATATAY